MQAQQHAGEPGELGPRPRRGPGALRAPRAHRRGAARGRRAGRRGLPARARHRPEQPLGSDQLAASLRAAESASSARPPTGSGFGSGWNPGSGWSSGSGWNPGSGWSSRTGSLARLWLELAGARSSAVALVGALAVGGFSRSSGCGWSSDPGSCPASPTRPLQRMPAPAPRLARRRGNARTRARLASRGDAAARRGVDR